jgi:hypothetical protein
VGVPKKRVRTFFTPFLGANSFGGGTALAHSG